MHMPLYETNSQHYAKLILPSFFCQLTDEEVLYVHFVQDNTMLHTTKNSMDALDGVFST